MEQVGKFKLYSMEEVLDRDFGPIGTPERDQFEAEVAEAVHAYEVGEAIKQARLRQNLTQEKFFARVDHSLQQAREGRVTRIETKEELTRFLEDL